MGKHRELASVVSKRTWRTIVAAGAMLAAPAITACGGKAKPPNDDPNWGRPTPPAEPVAAPDPAPAPAPDPAPATPSADSKDDAAKDDAAKDDPPPAETDDDADDTAAAKGEQKPAPPPIKVKRPRGGGNRPTGRGFILA